MRKKQKPPRGLDATIRIQRRQNYCQNEATARIATSRIGWDREGDGDLATGISNELDARGRLAVRGSFQPGTLHKNLAPAKKQERER